MMDQIHGLNLSAWSISVNPWVLKNDPPSAFTHHCDNVLWACNEAKKTALELRTAYVFECRKHTHGATIKLADPTYEGLLELVVNHFTSFG